MIFLLFTLNEPIKIPIFYISSPNGLITYCHCPEEPYGGLSRRKKAIEKYKKIYPELLILDSGDILSPFPNPKKDSMFIELYKKIPLDAVCLGDQDFVEGFDFFEKNLKPFIPYVCLNIFLNDKPFVTPYIIKEVRDKKILITGVISEDAFMFIEDPKVQELRIKDFKEALFNLIEEKKKDVDFFIVISHLGPEQEREIAEEIIGINLIINGHIPVIYEPPLKIKNTIIVGAGEDAKRFGIIIVELTDTIIDFENKIIPLDERFGKDEELLEKREEFQKIHKPDTLYSKKEGEEVLLFYSPECEQCKFIIEKFLPTMKKKYPGKFHIRFFNIENLENYLKLEEMEERYNDMDNEIPVMFAKGKVLGGKKEIIENFEKLIQEISKEPKSHKPFKEKIKPSTTQKKTSQDTIEIVYFYTYGCKACSRVEHALEILKKKYPILLKDFNIQHKENMALLEAFGEAYGVEENKRGVTPAVFTPSNYLLGKNIRFSILDSILKIELKRKINWSLIKEKEKISRKKLIQRFRRIGIFPVILAGLIDGVNPCAFAVLIFFITYLSVLGVTKKKMIVISIPFILAVFITYFMIGIGLYRAVTLLSILRMVSKTIVLLTALGLFVLSFLNFKDYYLFKQGREKEMKLKLSDSLRKRIHSIIRNKTTFGGFIVGTFITGFLVSVFEFVCTGQVYLPTIIYATQIPGTRTEGVFYLLMYNLSFILPLILVFLLSYFGMSEKRFQAFLIKRTGIVKIATGVVFLILGVIFILIISGIL